MDARSAILVLVLLYFSAIAARAEDAISEIGDDHHIKTKRHLQMVKRETDQSGDSESDEQLSSSLLKRAIKDDQHRPINDDTDSLGSLVARLHRKRCARTTAAATTATTAAAG